MVFKLLGLVATVMLLGICLPVTEGGPAYPGSTFNSWDTQPSPPQQQQPPQRRTPPGQKRTLQSVVRQHIDELDKQTQNDLKVLGYFENELNKIFSCYIKLSCARLRSPKVVSECEEIKDWPLYHQVMKMTGIRKYPYQNYAPAPYQRRLMATTEIPDMNQDDDTTDSILTGDEAVEEEEETLYQPQRISRRPNRRIRRASKSQQHQNHLTGAPVTNDEAE